MLQLFLLHNGLKLFLSYYEFLTFFGISFNLQFQIEIQWQIDFEKIKKFLYKNALIF